MTFKDQLALDNANVFMNTDEFCGDSILDGAPLKTIKEDVSFAEIGIEAPGAYGHAMILHVVAADLTISYVPNQEIDLDGTVWTVKDVRDEDGMLVFELYRFTS